MIKLYYNPLFNSPFKTINYQKGFKYLKPITFMKKGVTSNYLLQAVIILFIFAIALTFIVADDNSTTITNTTTTTTTSSVNLTGFDKSYSCLKEQIADKDVTTLSNEELEFSLLAMSYDSSTQSKLKTELLDREDANNCWPEGACTLKDTSLALLALDALNQNTKNIQSWLGNQTMNPSGIVWYLQIDTDASEKATCTITYDGTGKTVYVNEDKTVTGNAGSCFSSAYSGYWLQINSNCYNKDFQVSCNKDFLIATHFKKTADSTYYLSTTIHTASVGGSINTSVQSICFKQSGSCNYEGSLWAAMAMNKKDSTIRDKILPYLMVSVNDNKRYLPAAFLSIITGYDDYFTDLTNQQNTNGYWQISEQSRRYYDTAVALLALNGKAGQADTAKEYLLQPNVQGTGCWNNNIRDTAFVLYAASPKPPTSTLTTKSQCKDFGFSCTTSLDCNRNNGGILDNFACFSGFVCCNVTVTQQTCSDKGGVKCPSTQECSSGFISSSDSSYCCPSGGVCQDKTSVNVNECEEKGSAYSCKSSCESNENIESYGCQDSDSVCCSAQAKRSYWWIWILVLLIILLVLAFIFRNQLKVWLFKRSSGFSKAPASPQTRPPFPPNSPRPMMAMPRRIIPSSQQQIQRPPVRPMSRPMPRPFPKDRELDNTLKKLRDMSK